MLQGNLAVKFPDQRSCRARINWLQHEQRCKLSGPFKSLPFSTFPQKGTKGVPAKPAYGARGTSEARRKNWPAPLKSYQIFGGEHGQDPAFGDWSSVAGRSRRLGDGPNTTMKTDFKFSNLLGTVYCQGNLLFSPDGTHLYSPVGNRVTVFNLVEYVMNCDPKLS